MRARWTTMTIRTLAAQIDRELIDEADPLDPSAIPGAILVDAATGDILDGFHRVAGIAAWASGSPVDVPVIAIDDADLAASVAECPSDDAIEAAIRSAASPRSGRRGSRAR